MKPTRFAGPAVVSLVVLFTVSFSVADDTPSYNHDPVRRGDKTWVVDTEEGEQPISDLTAYCVDCHADLETSEKRIDHPPGGGVYSHPVDQIYPENGVDLVPLNELDGRLLLIDGAISCVTCHTPDSPDRHLVMSDAYGELCISCHRK